MSHGASEASSADRVLELLLGLIARDSLRVVDAAELLHVSRATAHRQLEALVRHGVAAQEHSGGPYGLATHFAMRTARSPRSVLLELARREARALRDEIGETTHFAVVQGNGCRFIVGFPGSRSASTPSRAGIVLPAHATAAGKAVLAALPPVAIQNLYPRGVQVLTDATLRSKEEISEHLRAVASRGYATNVSESEPGLAAVAVVVRGADGAPVGALAIAGPSDRIPATRLPTLATRMQRAALDIQSALLLHTSAA